MRAVGLRTLKNKLSEYVRLAASGETVLVTDRDRVVAEIVPPQAGRGTFLGDAMLADAVRRGWVTPPTVIGAYRIVYKAGEDDHLGARNVRGGKLGIRTGRRLCIAGAYRDVGRYRHLTQSCLVHSERLHDARRHGESGLHAIVSHVERRL